MVAERLYRNTTTKRQQCSFGRPHFGMVVSLKYFSGSLDFFDNYWMGPMVAERLPDRYWLVIGWAPWLLNGYPMDTGWLLDGPHAC